MPPHRNEGWLATLEVPAHIIEQVLSLVEQQRNHILTLESVVAAAMGGLASTRLLGQSAVGRDECAAIVRGERNVTFDGCDDVDGVYDVPG